MSDLSTLITLQPVIPSAVGKASAITVALIDNVNYAPASSSGGWQIVDRPKQAAATQWFDRAPWSIKFECYLDKSITSPSSISKTGLVDGTQAIPLSVEDDCNSLESLMYPIANTFQPPLLTLSGVVLPWTLPIDYWICYSLDFTDAIRDVATGQRIQQKVSITLYEYLPPLATGYTSYGIAPTSIFNSTSTATLQNTNNKPSSKSVKVPAGISLTTFAKNYKTTPAVVASLNKFSLTAAKNFGKTYANRTVLVPA